MKMRRQCQYDRGGYVQKYDRYGNVRQEWKAIHETPKRRLDQKPLTRNNMRFRKAKQRP